MISFVERYARRNPGISAQAAPAANPAIIIAAISTGADESARSRPAADEPMAPK